MNQIIKELNYETNGSLAEEGKFLTFALAGEEYGISIIKVREIIGMMPVTPVPRTPRHIKGVVNLRGRVIPVIDLRLKFGMDEAEYTERTCIIVVGTLDGEDLIRTGMVVDSVSEVLNIKSKEIEDAPVFGSTGCDTSYIIGMAKKGDGVKILMDINKVLSAEDMNLLEL